VYRTSKVMVWCGLLTIWTRCAATPLCHALHLCQRRLSMFLIPLVSLSENVYANLKISAALGEFSQHHTPFRPTI